MAYNRKGYIKRAKAIQELTAQHYEPGRQDRCYKWVWKKHIHPVYAISYHTYLAYLKVTDDEPAPQPDKRQLSLF